MKRLADILPTIWHKLLPKPVSARANRRLINDMAEREQRMDRLERVGLGKHAAENLYNRPRQLQD